MTGLYRFISLLAVIFSLIGCGTSASPKKTYTYVDADQQKAAEQGVPFEDPSKLTRKNEVTKAELAKLTKALDAAKATYKSDPSASNKSKVIRVTDDLASKTMDCAELTPHEKYSTALKLYRSALAIDPKDPEANEAANTIVAIYKSMGRPVPQ